MKKQKAEIVKIVLSTVFLFLAVIGEQLKLHPLICFAVYLSAYFICGGKVIAEAIRNIFKGHVFDEKFLMTIASLGAFIIGEHPEGVTVMLFFCLGELFENYALNKSRNSISELMDIRPDSANLKIDGEIIAVDPFDVNVGDTIVVKPGEKIALDGVVISGTSFVDTSALTGEAIPKEVFEGCEVLSGCINKNGVIEIQVTKPFEQSIASKILELVETAADNKAKSESFITKFSRYYTPVVVVLAVLLAFVPPLFTQSKDLADWIYRGLTFLVVSCPCALVISVPLSFFSCIGSASKAGILIKGSNFIEDLAKAGIGVFDKTGTLTKGVFSVREIFSEEIDQSSLLRIAAHAELYSNHPIALSIKDAYKKELDQSLVSDYCELSGKGVSVKIENEKYYLGNALLMKENGFDVSDKGFGATTLHLCSEKKLLGHIVISDEIKESSKKALELLRKRGIKTVMLTGDSNEAGKSVGEKLGFSQLFTQLLPTDKVKITEGLIEKKKENEKLFFVGDGINDAPVIALSDIGIAMGAIGSDAAIEAADIVIMNDDLSLISKAIDLSKKTLRIVKENIVFALSVKFFVLILSAFGFAPMYLAVFADVGVSFIAILNALRINNKTK